MKGNRYYLIGTVCGAVGMVANVVLAGIHAPEWERIAALCFAAAGFLVALVSARTQKSNRR